MTWQKKHTTSPCWSDSLTLEPPKTEEPGYIHTQTQPHTRKTSPPRCSPLTHDHHSRHTEGPRWHSQRSGGEKRTLAPSWDFVKVKVFLGFFYFFFKFVFFTLKPESSFLCWPFQAPLSQEQRWAAGKGASGRSSSSHSTCSDSSRAHSTPVRWTLRGGFSFLLLFHLPLKSAEIFVLSSYQFGQTPPLASCFDKTSHCKVNIWLMGLC